MSDLMLRFRWIPSNFVEDGEEEEEKRKKKRSNIRKGSRLRLLYTCPRVGRPTLPTCRTGDVKAAALPLKISQQISQWSSPTRETQL